MAVQPTLTSIRDTSLSLMPDLTNKQQETLVLKSDTQHLTRNSWIAISQAPNGGQGTIAVKIDENKQHRFVFTEAKTGKAYFQILKEKHTLRPHVYTAVAGATCDDVQKAKLLWRMEVKERDFRPNEWTLIVRPGTSTEQTLTLQSNVLGQDKAIMLSGKPIATITSSSLLGSSETINIAAGVDLGLVVGVAVARRDVKDGNSTSSSGTKGGDSLGKATEGLDLVSNVLELVGNL